MLYPLSYGSVTLHSNLALISRGRSRIKTILSCDSALV